MSGNVINLHQGPDGGTQIMRVANPIALHQHPRVHRLLEQCENDPAFFYRHMDGDDLLFSPREFKAVRRELQLSQEQLANILGVASRAVESYERDPSYRTAVSPTSVVCKMLWYLALGFRPPDYPSATKLRGDKRGRARRFRP